MESHCLMTRIRRSARAFQRKDRGFLKFCFFYDDSRLLLQIHTKDGQDYTLNPAGKTNFYQKLRYLVQKNHIDILASDVYISKGRSFRSIQQCPESNKFNFYGDGISFSGYRWIHRARLNLHNLNGNGPRKKPDGKYRIEEEKQCRRCGFKNETLNHVLCHCFVAHGRDMTRRHNAIINRIIPLIPKRKNVELLLDKTTKSSNKSRPDIVRIDHALKRVTIIDVTCPFELENDSLSIAAKRKIQKYSNEAAIFSQQGYKVYNGSFIIGVLGSWYQGNQAALNALDISRKRQKHLTTTIVGEVIENSKTIFWRHILGDKYQLTNNVYSGTVID
uniref:Reverse transcriptase n=1 Tax=Acrobeloides nanus TaxID=290746 RepID=A0A914DIZ9_9BILA